MQNYCKTIGALAAASALVAGTASAEVEYEIHTGYSSMYLFRGADLGDDLVELGLDVAGEYNGINLSAGVWAGAFDANTSLYGNTGNDADTEVNFYGEVSKDFGFLTGALGYIYYWNLASLGNDTDEIYLTLSRDLGFAEAYVSYFFNLGNNAPANLGYGAGANPVIGGDADYLEFGLTRGFELNSCVTLNLCSNIGALTTSDNNGFTAWTTRASLDWGFVENAKLSPFVALAVDLAQVRGLDDEMVAGSMLNVSF